MDDQLDETGLRPQFDVALARYAEDAERLAELTERLALGEVKAVLPGAEAVEVHGWMNEDWLKVLRIRSVRSAAGEVLYDVETGAEPAVAANWLEGLPRLSCELMFDRLSSREWSGSTSFRPDTPARPSTTPSSTSLIGCSLTSESRT